MDCLTLCSTDPDIVLVTFLGCESMRFLFLFVRFRLRFKTAFLNHVLDRLRFKLAFWYVLPHIRIRFGPRFGYVLKSQRFTFYVLNPLRFRV